MPSRPRPKSAPGSSQDRAGRRPRTGSTAVRRTTRVTRPDPAADPAPRSRDVQDSSKPPIPASTSSSRARFTGRAAILLLVAAVLAVSYASSARAWLQQRSDISTLRTQIAQHKAAIVTLQQAERRWHDPAYIEAQARLRFGWVMPGQTGYRVIDSHGQVLSNGASQLSQPTAGTHQAPVWWKAEWGSVVAAGNGPAAAKTKPHRKPAVWLGHHPRHATPRSLLGVDPRHDRTRVR
jgi:cell division protein FtsB